MTARQTISPDYRAEQEKLHQNPDYGTASIGFAPLVKRLMESMNARSVSDYGAGKCNLRNTLSQLGVAGFDYYPYDPAFPHYGEPRPADLVVCIDVLEHVEEAYLDTVLADLRDILRRVILLSIHTGPAMKVLSDGRNAHIIQQPAAWWLPRLCKYFEITNLERTADGFWVVAVPLGSA